MEKNLASAVDVRLMCAIVPQLNRETTNLIKPAIKEKIGEIRFFVSLGTKRIAPGIGVHPDAGAT